MTEPLELVIKGREDEPPVAYACPRCGVLFTARKTIASDDRAALKQEAALHCVKYCSCGNVREYPVYIHCSACRAEQETEKEQARFEKATKLSVAAYDDPVFWDGHTGSMGEGYFSNVDEVIDYCESEDVAAPEYVWTCTPHEFKMDAETILEHELSKQDMDYEALDRIPEKERGLLQAFLDTWSTRQGLVSWHYDCSRAVILSDV